MMLFYLELVQDGLYFSATVQGFYNFNYSHEQLVENMFLWSPDIKKFGKFQSISRKQ